MPTYVLRRFLSCAHVHNLCGCPKEESLVQLEKHYCTYARDFVIYKHTNYRYID